MKWTSPVCYSGDVLDSSSVCCGKNGDHIIIVFFFNNKRITCIYDELRLQMADQMGLVYVAEDEPEGRLGICMKRIGDKDYVVESASMVQRKVAGKAGRHESF